MKTAIKTEGINKILEILYLLILSAFLFWAILNTTRFQIVWPEYFYADLKAILLLYLILKVGFLKSYSKQHLILILIIGAVMLFNVNRNGYEELEVLLLLIIGAKDIEFRKIVKTYFAVMLALLLFTVASALMGKVENLVYLQEGRRSRMSLGIGYPTDFSAYIFYGVLSYIYIRGTKIKYAELLGSMLLGIGVYWITDARLNTICTLATVFIFIYMKWRCDGAKKSGKEYCMSKVWSFLLALAPVLCGTFMIVFSILYSSGSAVTNFLDRVLNYRLYQGNKAIDIYGFTLWGQYIPMQGYGGTTEVPKHYFFLDSSYLNIVMQYGLLVLGVVLLIWITVSFKARSESDWVLLWIVAIFSVQCMVEHHMLEIAYNPFLWALLANVALSKKQTDFRIFKKKREEK